MDEGHQGRNRYPSTIAEEENSATPPSSPPSVRHTHTHRTADRPPSSQGAHKSQATTRRHTGLARSYARMLSGDRSSETQSTAPHTHTRSRSRSSESASALLMFTTERLSQETLRANAAERRASELLVHLRTATEARDRLKLEVSTVQEEIKLYRVQLDLAQKEIFRAQEIVDKVEQARADAELRATREGDRVRKLTERIAVDRALEEGRRLGYQEGLERGRRMAWQEANVSVRQRTRRRVLESSSSSSVSEDPDIHVSPPPSPISFRNRRAATRVARDTPATSAPAAPIPVPAAQPQPPPPRPPSRFMGTPGRSPEAIDVHPVRQRTRSTSVSRRSATIPDNGIPTLGADSLISLPAPHELSDLPSPRPSSRATQEVRTGDSGDTLPSREGPRVRDYAYGGASTSAGRVYREERDEPPPVPGPYGRPTTVSTISRGSTRISQYDIVSPPRGHGGESPPQPQLQRRTRVRTVPERIVEEWRSANSASDTAGTGTPTPMPAPAPERERRGSLGRGEYHPPIPEPELASPRVRSPRVSGGPRRPREVVLPMPMPALFMRPSNARPAPAPQQPPSATNASPSTPTGPGQRARSPLDWLRGRFHQSSSSASVPQIAVESPSEGSRSTPGDAITDTALLTPTEQPTPLPVVAPRDPPQNPQPLTGLPPGFVPSSPNASYVEAPIPEGVRYPDPPRPASATAGRTAAGEKGHGRARAATVGVMQTSPAPLNRPISLFSDSG
ncbi:hypothetical protein BD779DRAFT_1678546 [Infundibulicybe gibba]|nr:hypothetical protein BD779DRAFT_1678546 [Infundibulicybe gibba]